MPLLMHIISVVCFLYIELPPLHIAMPLPAPPAAFALKEGSFFSSLLLRRPPSQYRSTTPLQRSLPAAMQRASHDALVYYLLFAMTLRHFMPLLADTLIPAILPRRAIALH